MKETLEVVLETRLVNPRYERPKRANPETHLNSKCERRIIQEVISDSKNARFDTAARIMLEGLVNAFVNKEIRGEAYVRSFNQFLILWGDDNFREINKTNPSSANGIESLTKYRDEKSDTYTKALISRALPDNHYRPGEGAKTELRIMMQLFLDEVERRRQKRDIVWFEQMIRFGMMDKGEK